MKTRATFAFVIVFITPVSTYEGFATPRPNENSLSDNMSSGGYGLGEFLGQTPGGSSYGSGMSASGMSLSQLPTAEEYAAREQERLLRERQERDREGWEIAKRLTLPPEGEVFIEEIFEDKLPLLSHLYSAVINLQLADSKNRIANGTATQDDYDTVYGEAMLAGARAKRNQRLLPNFLDVLTDLPSKLLDFSFTMPVQSVAQGAVAASGEPR